jgi:hypothetical protein
MTPEEIMQEAVDSDRLARLVESCKTLSSGTAYCFMCDTLVKERCDRENCLHAANERVRSDLGLSRHT